MNCHGKLHELPVKTTMAKLRIGAISALLRHPCRIQATCAHIRNRCALTSFSSGDCFQTFPVTFSPDMCGRKTESLCNHNMFADPNESENMHLARSNLYYKSPHFPSFSQPIKCSTKSNNLKIKFIHTVGSFQCCM